MSNRRRPTAAAHAEVEPSGGGYAIVRHDCHALENIATAAEHIAQIERDIQGLVDHARDEHGVTWERIGQALGVTRQSARQRWGH